jgi:fructose-bisphosphate aldolase class II
MARITLRQLLDHAAENDYGVPAFNINNMEQALAIMTAADKADAPVILQASRGARSYANDIMLKHMMDAVTEIYPHIPVCVHLDHGNEPGTCLTAIQAGFTSVMMDGSLKADGKSAADWAYNVGVTKQVAFQLKASLAFSVRLKPAWATRKTATALKVSSLTTSFSPILMRP